MSALTKHNPRYKPLTIRVRFPDAERVIPAEFVRVAETDPNRFQHSPRLTPVGISGIEFMETSDGRWIALPVINRRGD